MRAFLVSLLAFFIAGFAGGLVAQQLAESSGAGEEFILVFAGVMMADIIGCIAFFIAQLMSGSPTAVPRVGKALLSLVVVVGAGLIGWSLLEGGARGAARDWPILSGLIFPPLIVIVMQWLIVRGFQRPQSVSANGRVP